MKILWQKGIPHDFLNLPEEIIFFENDSTKFQEAISSHTNIEAIFFRANFLFHHDYLDKLPDLKYAALVSTGTENAPVNVFTQRNIQFTSGEGVNARAVAEYVVQALFLLWQEKPQWQQQGVGIIGKGRIGSMLVAWLQRNQIPVSWYDPHLSDSHTLEQVLEHPVISFHVPLTNTQKNATCRMLTKTYFKGRKPYIIQTSRGEIWDSQFYHTGTIPVWAQDVFPVEPPAPIDLRQAFFSTPHIAGYSTRGRLGGVLNGIRMILPELDPPKFPEGSPWYLSTESAEFKDNYTSSKGETISYPARALQYFNKRRDNFPYRKEFAEYTTQERHAFQNYYAKIDPTLVHSVWSMP